MTPEERAEEVMIRLQRNSNEARQKGIIRRAIIAAEEAKATEERETCRQIAHDARTEFAHSDEKAWYGALVIENRIRARSEPEKTEPKQLLTFDSLCMCGHVMSDHAYGDTSGYGACLNGHCNCRWFCSRSSEGEKKGK